MKSKLLLVGIILGGLFQINAQNNIVEEIAWVVGDEPIYKSMKSKYTPEQFAEVQSLIAEVSVLFVLSR